MLALNTIPVGLRSVRLYTWLLQFISDSKKEKIEEKLNYRTRYLTAVLENVFDHQNSNAVIRSCEALGMQDIHIVNYQSTFKPAKSVNKGSYKWMTVHRHIELDEAHQLSSIKKLKEKGYAIVATVPGKEIVTPECLSLDKPLAICFGQESSGISQRLLKLSDMQLTIPMYGFTESFNISVAAGIVFYELNKRLRKSNINWHLTETEKEEVKWQWLEKSLTGVNYLLKRYKEDCIEG